ncbi:hypothetical protein [Schaalia odontolytica]|uniref:Uncharacterized protein n=1 Tax=Schaalia odontolytica TaxID=1660 RepID=A0A2X0U1V2_9ACTO|nr:hypothetical protein [Schaalia odontolytica]WMS28285.1 hypothetical protein RDV55_04475 [Schaalia odontolytica]SPT55136.1 Uncharacterised protein [Schaalia odontolytica]
MDVNTSTDAVGNGSSADTAVAGERVERTGPGRRASAGAASICTLVAGLVVMSGFFLVRLASVADEMSASANLVIPGEFAVMSDGEFVRSLLPAAGVAGIVHLVGVVAGLMGRTRAEDRRELARCALGVGANAFFLACACITPVVGLVPDPRALVPLLVVCGAAVLAACVSLFRGMRASAGAISVGAGAAGMLAMAGALLVGLFAMLHELATTPGRPFLPALIVVAVCIHMSVPAGLIQLTGLIVGIRARRHADSEAERALAGRGIVLNVPLCWCVLFLPLLLLSAIP